MHENESMQVKSLRLNIRTIYGYTDPPARIHPNIYDNYINWGGSRRAGGGGSVHGNKYMNIASFPFPNEFFL